MPGAESRYGDSDTFALGIALVRRRFRSGLGERDRRSLEAQAGGFEPVEEIQIRLPANAGRQAAEQSLKIGVSEHRAVVDVHGRRSRVTTRLYHEACRGFSCNTSF